MPLIRNHRLPNDVLLGLWKIEEDPTFFENLLVLSNPEHQQLSTLKGRRRVEWLASRWLLHIMSDRLHRGSIIKDEFGKPHLYGSNWQISLSHTQGYAAAIAAEQPVGIDIQKRVDKIRRIAHKFITDLEQRNVAAHREIDYLHIYWGIKESLYKAYGRRAVDYRKNLFVHAFNLEDHKTTAIIELEETSTYHAHFELQPEFVLTYVVKN